EAGPGMPGPGTMPAGAGPGTVLVVPPAAGASTPPAKDPGSPASPAQPGPKPAARCEPRGVLLYRDNRVDCKLGDRLIVQLPRGQLAELRKVAGEDPLGLFLDGKFLAGI